MMNNKGKYGLSPNTHNIVINIRYCNQVGAYKLYVPSLLQI